MRIFLSYRREDASGHAGRPYDALASRYGERNVFMDVDTIDPGADFGEAITRAVTSCDALIDSNGQPYIVWTDPRLRVGAAANIWEAGGKQSIESLVRQWPGFRLQPTG